MTLGEPERRELELQFLLLDQDSDGLLKLEQLGTFLRAAGLYPSRAEVQGLSALVDPDGTGLVSKERALEAVESLLPHKLTTEDVKGAFKVLDDDADGYITAGQLRHVLVHFGAKLTHEEADAVIADAEKDKDGQINIDDLVTMLMTVAPLKH